jgi:hypothetical protein
MNPPPGRARLTVDFNELIEPDLVMLSQEDFKTDTSGTTVRFTENLPVFIYTDDPDENGNPGWLIADGVAEKNRTGYFMHVKWCCRINEKGIRHLCSKPPATR